MKKLKYNNNTKRHYQKKDIESTKRNLKYEKDVNKRLRNEIQKLKRAKDEVCNKNKKYK